MPEETKPAKGESKTEITEEALLKSLSDLEGKQTEPPAKEEPKVVVQTLEKSAKDALAEGASPELKKALEVSSVLKEAVDLYGLHVDHSLTTLQKSLQGAAERDNSMIRVLEGLKKSIDSNTEALNKLMDKPATTPSARATQVEKTEVLAKSAPTGEQKTTDPAMARKKVLTGLELLAKSAGAGTNESMKYTRAAVKFESTGKIDDLTMGQALEAYNKQVGQK